MRLLCLFFLIASETVLACAQGAGMSPDSYLAMPRSTGPVSVDVAYLRERYKAEPDSRMEEIDAWYAEHIPEVSETDREWWRMEQQALRAVFTGRYEDAIAILLAMEELRPGEYATASTLGTAYELAGDNHLALEWISEGIRRNPGSHGGTEWLHVDILKAKIAMQTDPHYLATHPIVPHAAHREPWVLTNGDSNGQQAPGGRLIDALLFQLGERMLFVKPEDPVVADLLYSFARLEAARGSSKGEKGLLKLARTYGHPQAAEEMPTLAGRAVGMVQSPLVSGRGNSAGDWRGGAAEPKGMVGDKSRLIA